MVQTTQPPQSTWAMPDLQRWLLPLSALLILVGYFGPWVPHRVAGLVVTGLDLGEYVKFLPTVRGGQVTLWREGFYLPLVAVSLALSLAAFRPQWRYGWPMRSLLLIIAGIAALNLLPPAWGPATFTNPEFRQQIGALVVCLGAAAISPFLAFLPRWVGSGVVLLLSIAALWFPLRDFLRVLPTIRELYNEPLSLGWGVYVMVIGLVLMIVVQLTSLLNRTPKISVYTDRKKHRLYKNRSVFLPICVNCFGRRVMTNHPVILEWSRPNASKLCHQPPQQPRHGDRVGRRQWLCRRGFGVGSAGRGAGGGEVGRGKDGVGR